MLNIHTTKSTNASMLNYIFYLQFVITPTRFDLDHPQGVTEHQRIYKNRDRLLNTLKFVHKISADITYLLTYSMVQSPS